MQHFNRRQFIQSSAAMLPFLTSLGMTGRKQELKLSFSTLGCPDWEFDAIVDFAAQHHFKGLELRGLKREIDLTKSKTFKDKAAIKTASKLVKDKGLKIINLGASTALHHTAKEEREKNLDEAKRYIELAEQLNCPFVRVFPNNLPKDDTRSAIIELIIQGLQQLGAYAKGSGVTVLLESHGDVVRKDDLAKILSSVDSKQVGLIWDITNMWTVTRETPADVYPILASYIKHVHIKDAKLNGDKLDYVLLGNGDTSIMQAIDLLFAQQYQGYYSFEWEKLWHPEIAEPEIAIADFAEVMHARFAQKK